MRHYAKFHKIGQTVAEIWRFNGFQNGGRPPSWICEIRIFLMVCAVKGHILHQRTKFHKDTVKPLRRYHDFCHFSRWRPPPFWIFKNSKF